MIKRTMVALAILFLLSCTTPIQSKEHSIYIPTPTQEFAQVVVPSITPTLAPTPTPKPTLSPHKKAEFKAAPKPKPQVARSATVNGSKHKGIASWYCNYDDPNGDWSRCTVNHPDVSGQRDYYAAIRKDLLFLRGRTIQACAGDTCINVKIIDCNCGKHANIIDLYADAFAGLYDNIGKGRRPVRLYY